MLEDVVNSIYHRMSLEGMLAGLSRTLIFKRGLNGLGEKTYISPYAHLLNMRCMDIGSMSSISRRTSLLAFTEYRNVKYNPKISIGDNVYIGKGCTLSCCNYLAIEDGVTIGDNVYISDNMHGYEDINISIMEQPLKVASVVVGCRAWVGYGSFIAHDVNIGEHAIIGAGSVVKKSVPPFTVVAGSPAKIIKRYDFDQCKWVKASE